MPRVVKPKSAKQVRLSSRSKSPRKRADREESRDPASLDRDEAFRICTVQKSRMLSAAARAVSQHGYNGLTVARITAGANVSRRTFYEQFADREDCFLELFETAATRTETLARNAAADKSTWQAQVRAGLSSLLAFIDDEPALGSLLVVDVLGAGPTVLGRRAHRLDALAAIIDQGHNEIGAGDGPPPLTAEGLVGAVLGVIHARLLSRREHRGSTNGSVPPTGDPGSLTGLLNALMAMIVQPYLGRAAATEELARRLPQAPRTANARHAQHDPSPVDPLQGLDMRLTYRTLRVLAAIAAGPGTSNREVADAAGVQDQGQISKLLARLERLGLVHNHGDGQPRGESNSWMLTPRGIEVATAVEAQQV
jgi:AcrR family transcriptional regulator/DNA-binding MarR family transcriptional regulator